MQDEAPELCVICQDTITDDFAYPCEHAFHAKCAYRWFESQMTEGNDMTCPICRHPPTNGWRIFEIRCPVVAARRTGLSVGPDTTVRVLKEYLAWRKAYPPKAVTLFTVLKLNETTERKMIMHDSSWVGALNGLFINISLTEAEYRLLDLPKGHPSTDRRYVCPLSHSLLLNPVRAADGITYERAAIEKWSRIRGNISPRLAQRPLLPLTEIRDPAFEQAVRTIQIVPMRPVVTDLDKEITVNVICPMIDARPFKVKYGDPIMSIARRAMPNTPKRIVLLEDGLAFKHTDNPQFTVAQGYVKDGDTLYVMTFL